MRNGRSAPMPEREAPEVLRQAFNVAIAFPTDAGARICFSKDALDNIARLESASGPVPLGEPSLEARTALLAPAKQLMQEWRKVREGFDLALQPAMPGIRAAEKLRQEIAELAERRARQKAAVTAQMQTERRYAQLRARYDEAEARFRTLREEHGNRDARLTTSSWFYWLLMLCLGFAEWLINYDVFYLFVGIPAIAGGATILIAVSLALAAHHFGKLFKQWSHRFGKQRARAERLGDWRILALAAFLLVAVFVCAAGSRWAAVMHQLNSQPAINILGADAAIDINPERDILLSLLWNVMAWVVGVIISYMAHDADPDYMDATRQYRRAARAHHRFCRPYDDDIRTVDAKFAKDIEGREMAAATQLQLVEPERQLHERIEEHEAILVKNIVAALHVAAPALAGKINPDLIRRLEA